MSDYWGVEIYRPDNFAPISNSFELQDQMEVRTKNIKDEWYRGKLLFSEVSGWMIAFSDGEHLGFVAQSKDDSECWVCLSIININEVKEFVEKLDT